ncbi:MAG: hypothetical protein NT025_00575 [bacterium]|nr:hypothetical protein [bacterium]
MYSRVSFFVVSAFCMLALATAVQAFDISAYWDPISMVQLEGHGTCLLQQCEGDSCRVKWLRSISEQNNSYVLQRYQEMGITNLCVHYRPSDFNDYLAASWESGETLGVMNERWPNRMYQYLEAQGAGRRLEAAVAGNYVDARTSVGSWGQYASVDYRDVSGEVLNAPVLAIGPGNGTVQEFFRPAVGFGSWLGWARREIRGDWLPVLVPHGGSNGQDTTIVNGAQDHVMPMVFRLVLDYDRDPNAPTAEICKFYWYFKNAESEWLRYYPVTIDTTMIQHQAGQFDTLLIRIDPIDYTYTRNGVGRDTVIYSCDDPFDWTWDPTRTLDMDYFGYYDVSSYGREGRFEIRYSGYHTLYLYSVEAMDDAYYRMFEAPYATIQATNTMIADSFAADLGRWPSPHMRGWYYDEIYDYYRPFLRSWLRVQQILHDDSRHLPTFFFNGFAFDDDRHDLQMDSMYYLFDHGFEGSQPQTFMLETYYFWGETDSVSFSWYYPPAFYTRFDSDEPYVDSTYVGDATWPEGRSRQYNGTQSLQRAIDWTYWRVPDTTVFPFLSADQRTGIHNMALYPGFIDQVQLQHDPTRGGKLWALLQAGRARGDSSQDVCRDPSPQEIKLEAWMAVASNADGIMYYWGTPSGPGPHPGIGGLFKWSTSNFCADGGASVDTTERWLAAKEVDHDILLVTPILESLKFVKTYASRAFEHNYPNSTHAATAPDTLADHVWCGNSVRAVQAIRSYMPCWPEDTTCFITYSESQPYVQVSRFRNQHVPYLDPDVEDYWFLVVNRRTLSYEWRKIELDIPVIYDGPYYVRYVLGDSTKLQPISTNRETDCHLQTITLILRPGEAELIHFTHGENGCQDASAHVEGLTAIAEGNDAVRLNWEEPTQTEDSLPFTPQTYFILRSVVHYQGPFDTIAYTETNTYLDSLSLPERVGFYMVHACGTISERPGNAPIEAPEKPKKEKVAPGAPSLSSSIKRSG